MTNKHKYYDAIVAWASGENIQVRNSNEYTLVYGEPANRNWTDFYGKNPDWAGIEWEWRVKPKTQVRRWRMALVKRTAAQGYVVIAFDITDSCLDFPIEHDIKGFIRWVGDIAEVEVEV